MANIYNYQNLLKQKKPTKKLIPIGFHLIKIIFTLLQYFYDFQDVNWGNDVSLYQS